MGTGTRNDNDDGTSDPASSPTPTSHRSKRGRVATPPRARSSSPPQTARPVGADATATSGAAAAGKGQNRDRAEVRPGEAGEMDGNLDGDTVGSEVVGAVLGIEVVGDLDGDGDIDGGTAVGSEVVGDTANASITTAQTAVRPYTMSHYAKASIEDGEWDRLQEWMEERGVELSFADTVFCVDVCPVHLTPAHYATLNGGSDEHIDLDALCRATLSGGDPPDWVDTAAGESIGDFESEFRVGMDPLGQWCAQNGGLDESALQELLEEIVEGAGMTDSLWIEEA